MCFLIIHIFYHHHLSFSQIFIKICGTTSPSPITHTFPPISPPFNVIHLNNSTLHPSPICFLHISSFTTSYLPYLPENPPHIWSSPPLILTTSDLLNLWSPPPLILPTCDPPHLLSSPPLIIPTSDPLHP